MMGKFYLVDILEIALLAEESGNVYHSFVKINYSVPSLVQLLTGITNITIETHGVPFRYVMDGLVQFIRREATDPLATLSLNTLTIPFDCEYQTERRNTEYFIIYTFPLSFWRKSPPCVLYR